MMDRIEDGFRALTEHGTDAPLSGLESDVWRGIKLSEPSFRSLAPAAMAGVVAALGFGTLVGGMSAAAQPPTEIAAFDVRASLAPSTLLDGGS